MKGKTIENFKNYIDVKERIPNSYFIREAFKKYYLNKMTLATIKPEDGQKVIADYDNVRVQTTPTNDTNKLVDKLADYDRYVKAIDGLMEYLHEQEPFYYQMIDYYYRQDFKHKQIMRKLNYFPNDPRDYRAYYREWDKAVSYFVREALNRNINVN